MNLFRPLRPQSGEVVATPAGSVRLKVNPRARRVSLRLDAARGEVVAVAPSPARLKDAVAFAHARGDWIRRSLAGRPAPQPFRPGRTLSVLGEACLLTTAASRREAGFSYGPEGLRLAVQGEGEAYGRAAERRLRRRALDFFRDRSHAYAEALGREAPAVALIDARSRWGSCSPPTRSSPGKVRYCWRLVLAPEAVADYVAAHECAHLVEANHGPRFWALVRRLHGPEGERRAWLRAEGARLHALGRG